MLRLCKIGDQTTFSSLLSSVKLKFAENLCVHNLVLCVRAFYTASDDGTKEKYEINLFGCAFPWPMFEKPTISYQI